MSRNRLLFCLLAGLSLLILISEGCGKKGDPIPPQIKLPAAIVDLRVASIGKAIALSWSLTGPLERIGAFTLLRSVTTEGSEACPGCPQDYRPFGTLAIADNRLQREAEKGFRYIDTDVSEGHFYSYRVVVCDRAGLCGKESNTAGLIHSSR